ncbi:MAG: tRNA pseudouridine(55) synthase TruB [Thermoanaerobaculia bacterium]
MIHGVLLVDKDAGGTSHDAVQRARRILREKKIGHCGTLDPAATGLLVLTVGKATRLTRFLISAPKVYEGTIRFGIETDTYDATGEVVAEKSVEGLDEAAVREALEGFVGTQEQAAPAYSAKKVQGRKYYELARQGEEVPTSTKEITIFELEATGGLDEDSLAFRLACTSGTYVRSLAHDLGRTLGCGAHLSSLRRLRVGPFRVEDAERLDRIEELRSAESDLGSCWVPFDEIPLPFPAVTADAVQEQRIGHGQTILVRDLAADEGDWIRVSDRRGRLLAVGSVTERIGAGGVGVVQPRIVFAETA